MRRPARLHRVALPAAALLAVAGLSGCGDGASANDRTVQVTVGASDSLRTQILSGLNVGDNVIIATVSSTVPSSTTTRGTTGGGLFGAGGGRGGAGAIGRALGG